MKSSSTSFSQMRRLWIQRISRDPRLSPGDKHFAAYVCSNYVNNTTGLFWPKNKTLARDTAVCDRTIKRRISKLKQLDYIESANVPGVRRAFRICLPCTEGDNEGDKRGDLLVTVAPPKGDSSVTPYMNKKENKIGKLERNRSFRTISVGTEDSALLQGWARWIELNTVCDSRTVLEMLEKDGVYALPCRHPVDESKTAYLEYFEFVCRAHRGTDK